MLKNYFMGTFEIALFMKTGINHFSNEHRHMVVSFIFPLLGAFLLWMSLPYAHQGFSDNANLSLNSYQILMILKYGAVPYNCEKLLV